MVRRAVSFIVAGTVNAECHRQTLQSRIVNEIVVGALQKRRVDRGDRMETACSKLPGINSISIYFMAQKMTVDFADGADVDATLDQIEKTCKKVERSFELYR